MSMARLFPIQGSSPGLTVNFSSSILISEDSITQSMPCVFPEAIWVLRSLQASSQVDKAGDGYWYAFTLSSSLSVPEITYALD